MTRVGKGRGFTLVEMLVVISIIVVLVAILVPTIQTARHKARLAQCRTQLSDLTLALTNYERRWHRYPPRPVYDSTLEMYHGGFSALYPDYIDDWTKLVCPDDRTIDGQQEEAKARRYSSYNGRINMAEDPSASEPWDFAVDSDTGNQMITYNYNGYDYKGWDRDTALAPPSSMPTWLESWRKYPRLINRYAPEYTLVTHCTFHRDFYHEDQDKRDTIVRLDSDTDLIVVQVWQDQSGGASQFEVQEP